MNSLGTWAASLPARMLRRFVRLRQLAAAVLLTGMVVTLVARPAAAQPFDDFRSSDRYKDTDTYRATYQPVTRTGYERVSQGPTPEEVESILRSLVESELKRRELAEPLHNAPAQVTPRTLNRPTREMEEARRALPVVSREADRLTTLLSTDMRTVAGVRPYFDDLLRLRARVGILTQRARQFDDHEMIREDLKTLDKDWRLLAYRLSQLRGLSHETIRQVQAINEYAKALGKTFEISPQLDTRELLSHTASLSSGLHSLMEDIEIELPRSQQKTDLLLEGRRVEQQARQCYNTVADGRDYRVVLDDYKLFQQMWYPFATRLRPLNNRYLERDVRRVNEIDNRMHELLWLPQKLDRDKLLHLTSLLTRDVDDFFVRAPLKLLIDLPNADQVLAVSDQFYGMCANFNDVVQRGEDTQQVVEAYRYIEDGWRAFSAIFFELRSQAAQQVLSEINRNIDALGQALQIEAGGNTQGYDNSAVLAVAASIDNLAAHLESDIGRWLSQSRETFRTQALRDAAVFTESANRLHEQLALRADPRDLVREIDQLNQDWRRVYQWVVRCNTVDKPHLDRVAAEINPQIIELQTLMLR